MAKEQEKINGVSDSPIYVAINMSKTADDEQSMGVSA